MAIVSELAVPPLKSAGENEITPLHTPLAVLHLTVPGRTVGSETAPAVPLLIVTKRSEDTPTATR